jgi:hypothetical protein
MGQQRSRVPRNLQAVSLRCDFRSSGGRLRALQVASSESRTNGRNDSTRAVARPKEGRARTPRLTARPDPNAVERAAGDVTRTIRSPTSLAVRWPRPPTRARPADPPRTVRLSHNPPPAPHTPPPRAVSGATAARTSLLLRQIDSQLASMVDMRSDHGDAIAHHRAVDPVGRRVRRDDRAAVDAARRVHGRRRGPLLRRRRTPRRRAQSASRATSSDGAPSPGILATIAAAV